MKIRDIKNKNMKWWIGTVSCVLLFVFITIFGYEKMCFIWHGVKIDAIMKEEAGSNLVTITGVAEKAILLSLNGREIFIDKEGNFSEQVSPLSGYSIITLNAKDKFGKTAEKKFELVREEKSAEAIALADKPDTNTQMKANDTNVDSRDLLLELTE